MSKIWNNYWLIKNKLTMIKSSGKTLDEITNICINDDKKVFLNSRWNVKIYINLL
jgi:hypothetical protein